MTQNPQSQALSVTRLSAYLKRLLTGDPQLRSIAVRGEITNAKPPSASAKAFYFSLKDDAAVINCVVWPESIPGLPSLRDGLRVVVYGGIDVFPRGGRYQLNLRKIELDGAGAHFVALEELRVRLQSEGLFAVDRKRALPRFPFRVGLISSQAAQGAQDFIAICERRSPHIQIVLHNTSVQGLAAGGQIARAINVAATKNYDLLVMVRGGGASEDLWAFNDEAIVRAICAAPMPVMTGIGHESDISLADHAADIHAATPTDAATRLPALLEIRRVIRTLQAASTAAALARIRRAKLVLGTLAARLEKRSPAAQMQARRNRFAHARIGLERSQTAGLQRRLSAHSQRRERLVRAAQTYLERRRHRLRLAQAKLHGRDPEAILELGYAIVRSGGKVVNSTENISPGAVIEARLAYGTLAARVESLEHHGREADRPI